MNLTSWSRCKMNSRDANACAGAAWWYKAKRNRGSTVVYKLGTKPEQVHNRPMSTNLRETRKRTHPALKNPIKGKSLGWQYKTESNRSGRVVSCINLAWNDVQLLTLHLSPYLNTDSLFVHGFPSFIQWSSSEQPSTHSLRSSCLTQMPLDPYLRIPST